MGGRTDRTRRAGTGTVRRELLGERAGQNGRGLGRPAQWGRRHGRMKISKKTINVSWVCVGVQEFLRGEVGSTYRGWYVRSVSECTTSGMAGTGYWNPHYTECPRPTWTWEYFRRLSSQNVFICVSLVATGWWRQRRRVRTAAASPYSTERRSTYL